MGGLIAAYALHSLVGGSRFRDEYEARRYRSRVLSKYCRLGLRVLGVKLGIDSALDLEDLRSGRRNFLVVSNHLSYLDVLVMAALWPSLFVTSVEVQKTAGLGHLCVLAGALFVERRNRDRIQQEVGSLATALSKGMNVVVFPEATSSAGATVLPFKSSMFEAALQAKVEVLPLCIRLTGVNGETLTEVGRDSVCYYGTMEFLPHFLGLLRLKSVELRLSVMAPIRSEDRRELRDASFQAISREYENPEMFPIFPSALPEANPSLACLAE